MTGHPLRRLSDSQSRAARWLAWLRSPAGQAVQGLWLLFLSCVVTGAVVVYMLNERHTAQISRMACERTQILAPPLGDYFEREGALTAHELETYRSSIPEDCS